MTVEEHVSCAVNRLAVVERVLALELCDAATDIEPLNRAALTAGLRELVEEVYDNLTSIENAPLDVTQWELDPDKQTKPDGTGQHNLKPVIAEFLGPEHVKSRGLFDPAFVQRILKENASGAVDHTYLIYALLNLEIWQQTFLDNPGVEVTL